MTIKLLYYESWTDGQYNEMLTPTHEHGVEVEMQSVEMPSRIIAFGFRTYIMTVAITFSHEQEVLQQVLLEFKKDSQAIRHAIETFDRHKKIIEQRLQSQVEA
jgi:hypothetical protein